MGQKTCPRCHKTKPRSEYYKRTEGGERSYCKQCCMERVYESQQRKKRKAIKWLGGKCVECGETRAIVLQLHHKNPKEKERGWRLLKGLSWERIKKELKKCELRCANCHIVKHAWKDSKG